MAVDPHRTAVLALLASLPMPLYTEAVPNGTLPPYVRVYMTLSYPGMEDLRSTSDRALLRMVFHCVGASSTAADIVAGAVRTALLDVVPVVSGRACFPIRNESSANARPDETTGALVMDTIDIYRLESVPG